MAVRKSTRSKAGRARPSGHSPARSPDVRGRKPTQAASCPAVPVEPLRQLTILVRRLRAIYGTAVTAELALRQQAADEDPEIADCLRVGVCDPIDEQIQNLGAIIGNLQADSPGTAP